MDPDPFDDLLVLEEKFYDEGFQLGTADGAKAGRIEGRVFGLEKGFEKYVEMGKLHGKSLIWAGRISSDQAPTSKDIQALAGAHRVEAALSLEKNPGFAPTLSPLPPNPRLSKHVKILYALTEPISLSTENSEDSVSDFDDRLKRALGKVKIVEKLVGEEGYTLASASRTNEAPSSTQNVNKGGDSNIEDMSVLRARR